MFLFLFFLFFLFIFYFSFLVFFLFLTATDIQNQTELFFPCFFFFPSINVDLVRDISWSPKQRVLAYWSLEPGSDIARVTLLDVNTMTPIRKLAVYKVFDVRN